MTRHREVRSVMPRTLQQRDLAGTSMEAISSMTIGVSIPSQALMRKMYVPTASVVGNMAVAVFCKGRVTEQSASLGSVASRHALMPSCWGRRAYLDNDRIPRADLVSTDALFPPSSDEGFYPSRLRATPLRTLSTLESRRNAYSKSSIGRKEIFDPAGR